MSRCINITACALLLLVLSIPANAGMFENQEQEAARLYEEGRYKEAAETFEDPYRCGVALYRAGEYRQAARTFQQYC